MENQQIYIKEILAVFETFFKLLIEAKYFDIILYLIIKLENFNIYHQTLMRFFEIITHKFIPDFIHEYLFEIDCIFLFGSLVY